MSILAQGTQIYFIDSALSTPAVVEVYCATSFNPAGNPADPLDDTCLAEFDRTYKMGLRTPGVATLTINADPAQPSHVRMHDLSKMNPSPILHWAVGMSDGTAPPTLDIYDEFILPTSRSWFTFDGYISDFPFDFALGALLTTSVSIQRSGGSEWTVKV